MAYFDTPQGPLAQVAPEGDRPSRSILDGVLKALFPAGAYEGVLPPEALQEERRMQMRHAGLQLMASGMGTRPQGTGNSMADLASALDPNAWEQRLAAVAESSQKLRAQQQKIEQQTQVDGILRQFSAKPGETDEQRDQRLLGLANAFQSAGLLEEAKAAADLRVSLRKPALRESNGILWDDRTGQVVGQLPDEVKTVEGQTLYNQALARIDRWNPIRTAVMIYNQKRTSPLDQPSSAALVSAAQQILNTHMAMTQADGDIGKAIEHLPLAGQLFKVLQALGGTQQLTEPQRRELLAAVDPVINSLAAQHDRDVSETQRIFHEKWKDEAQYNRMWNLLPQSPSFNALGTVVPKVVQQMNDDRR